MLAKATGTFEAIEAYQAALDQHLMVAVTDRTGHITYVNEPYCALCAHGSESLLGNDFSLLKSGHHEPNFWTDLWRTVKAGRVWRGEICNRNAQGSQYWVDTTIVPLPSTGASATHYAAIQTDISQRKSAEQHIERQLRRQQDLSRMARVGLWEFDPLKSRVDWSDVACSIYGLPTGSRPPLIEMLAFYPKEQRKKVTDTLARAISAGTPIELESQIYAADGQMRWIRTLGIAHFENNRCTSVVGTVQDVTADKALVEALRVAQEIAGAASRTNSAVLANISHEIRTPLNGIVGMTELLLDTKLTEQQNEYAEMVLSSGKTMLALFNDLLDLAKFESGRLELEAVDFNLRDIVADSIDTIALVAAEKRIALLVDIDPRMKMVYRGDPTRLRQILLNLLSNAVKFTAEGEVLVTATDSIGSQGQLVVRCSVKDTGIGISAGAIAKLFTPFTQADASTTRRYGGTGLGLSICKHLVEAMQGSITVRSKEGSGTIFEFDVPLSPPAEESKSAEQQEVAEMRILLVDRNARHRHLLSRDLRQLARMVRAVGSAAEALRVWSDMDQETGGPDLVLVDDQVVTGGSDAKGAALVDRIACGTAQGVLLTSLAAARSPSLGINVFAHTLTKPLKRSALVRLMRRHSESQAASSLATLPIVPSGERRVLLVEDNIVNQILASRLLQKLGMSCVVANNGVAAIAALREQTFDLVLMDCQMPTMDGYEATRMIRARSTGLSDHTIPIIAMTANALAGDREACLEAGMTDYITKPVNLMRLRETIDRILSARAHVAAAKLAVKGQTPLSANIVDLLRLTGDSRDLVADLLSTFLESSRKLVAELSRCTDAEQCQQLVQRLQSSASIVCATGLVSVIQAASAQERSSNIAAWQAQIITAWNQTVASIETALRNLMQSTTPA